jgi:hypothetical protein
MFFYFLKIIIDIRYQNDLKIFLKKLIWNKKNLIFFKIFLKQKQTGLSDIS